MLESHQLNRRNLAKLTRSRRVADSNRRLRFSLTPKNLLPDHCRRYANSRQTFSLALSANGQVEIGLALAPALLGGDETDALVNLGQCLFGLSIGFGRTLG